MNEEYAQHHRMLAERRAMLLSLDPVRCRAFLETYSRWDAIETIDDEMCLVIMHKGRVETRDLPEHERAVSRTWLIEHNYRPGIL